MVTKLKSNQIFIFGSNLAGNHAGGAAYQAWKDFGAEMGVGEGLTGQCYAFPTLEKNMQKRLYAPMLLSVMNLKKCAESNPDKEFLLTKVGEGIAGYSHVYMNELFKGLPKNIRKV